MENCKAGTNPETGRVCSKHFLPSDYTETSMSGESMLKPDAVPTPCADTKLYLQCSVKLERADLNKLKGDLIKDESDKKENTTAGPISVEEKHITIGQQLHNVLQSGVCCCVCLRRRDGGGTGAGPQRDDAGSATTLQLQLPGDRSCSLRDALWAVLAPEVPEIAETGYLCEQCTDSTISAYLFIENAKDTANTLSKYISHLQEEVDVILAKLEQGDVVHQVFFSFPSYMDEVEPKKENDETQLFDIRTVDTDDSAKWEEYDTLDIKDASLTTTDQTSRTDRTALKKHIARKRHKKNTIHKKDTTAKKNKIRKRHRIRTIKSRPRVDQLSSRELSHYKEHWRCQRAAGQIRTQCIDCGYATRVLKRFLEHARLKHIRKVHSKCPKCQGHYYSKVSFELHLRRCYANLYICAYCDEEFHRRAKFVSHVTLCQTAKREFACDKCDATFDTETDVSTHTQKRHAPSDRYTEPLVTLEPCKICCKKFANYKDYTDHKKECKMSTDLVLCPECGVCVKNLHQHLRWHREVHDGVNGNAFNAAGKPVRRRRGVLCELCGKWFRSRTIMNKHVENSHLKIRVRCTVCSKNVLKCSLKEHMKRHQENWEEIFEMKKRKRLMNETKCDECDYSTTSKISMMSHVNRYHEKVRPFKCEMCCKSFFNKTTMVAHARTHGPKRCYVCDECGREYTTRAGVRVHIIRDHSTARPYECITCGKRFNLAAKLTRHRYTHMPPERCPVKHCGSMHNGWIAVKKHLKRKHWNKSSGPLDPALIPGMDPEAVERFGDRRGSTIPGRIYDLS